MGEIGQDIKNKIQKILNEAPQVQGTDYSHLFNAKTIANNLSSRNNPNRQQTPTYNNPYMNNSSTLSDMIKGKSNNGGSSYGWGMK